LVKQAESNGALTLNQTLIPCILSRGGTPKGPFPLAHVLPADPAGCDAVSLAAVDLRNVRRIGGTDSLASQAVRRSANPHSPAKDH